MIRFTFGAREAIPSMSGGASHLGLSINFSRVLPSEPTAQVSIHVRRITENVAPDAVLLSFTVDGFDVTSSTPSDVYDPTYHDLYYLVDWDDPGAEFTSPEKIPDEWRNANIGYGPTPAHVYQRPGTYNPSVLVVDRSGNWAVSTVDEPIIVNDPAILHPGAQTICVANDGDFSDAPAGCQHATSFSQGWNLYRNLPAGEKGRLLLKRGDVYEDYNRTIDGNFGNWYLGAWGNPMLAKPVITAANTAATNIHRHFNHASNFGLEGGVRYTDIHFEGLWDPQSETGTTIRGVKCSPGAATLINRCSSHNMKITVQTTAGTGANAILVVNEMDVEGWQDFAAFVEGNIEQTAAFIGCRFVQDPLANIGAGGKSQELGLVRNEHACLRIQLCGTFYMDCVDFFSRNGWEQIHAHPTEQAPLRYHFNDSRSREYFSRCAMEGGMTQFTVGDATSGGTLVPINLVVDKALLLGSAQSRINIGIELGGVTRRNILAIMPDTPNPSYGVTGNIMGDTDLARSTEQNRDTPVKTYNCTAVWLKSDANLDGASPTYINGPADVIGFRNVTSENNITLAPSRTVMDAFANSSVADFDIQMLWAPRNFGRKHREYTRGTGQVISAQPTFDNAYATPTDSVQLFVPRDNPKTTANGDMAWDDLMGRPRYSETTDTQVRTSSSDALEPN